MFFGGDPFGDPFESFQRHAHQQAAGRARRQRDVNTSKLYETLGVPKTATAKEIKKAYRKLAVQHHPDKGGDEQKFKEISAAHEILGDEEKRKIYDERGLEGLAEGAGGGGPGGMDMDDLFGMFFGGGARGGGGGSRRRRRTQDVQHPVSVTLSDLYNGKTLKMAVTRQKLVGEARICRQCEGHGVVRRLRQLGLGMVQQIQHECDECEGEGQICSKEVVRQVVEVHVEKGMRHKQRVTFAGMADERPGMETGDVHFVVMEKEHEVFKRKGADLLITHKLTLKEALTGFAWKITHLDKREIVVKSKPGEVICSLASDGQHPFVKMIPNEGMPSRGNPFIKGNLYVLFTVQFPGDGELSGEAIDLLRKHLPGPDPMEFDDNDEVVEVVQLEHTPVSTFGQGGAETERNGAYDSDDDRRERTNCQPT